MPFGLNHAAYATVGNECHIFSGRIGGNGIGEGGQNVYLVYNMADEEWQTPKEVPEGSVPRGGMGNAVYHNGKLVITGGEVDETERAMGKTRNNVLNLVDVLDVVSGKWKSWDDTEWTPRHGQCSVVVDDKIWVVGGGTEKGKSESDLIEELTV